MGDYADDAMGRGLWLDGWGPSYGEPEAERELSRRELKGEAMRIPTKKKEAVSKLSDLTILIYGAPKIGKSTFAAQLPGACFIPTEAGLNSIECLSMAEPLGKECFTCWEEVRGAAIALEKRGQEVKPEEDHISTVIIDTAEEMISLASEYVVSEHNVKSEKQVEHISEIGYGKGYNALWLQAREVIQRLAKTRYGLWIIAHEVQKTKEGPDGEYQYTCPGISGKIGNSLAAIADMILFIDLVPEGEEEKRIIRTKPTIYLQAGDRTGKLPAVLPFEYDGLRQAFEANVTIKAWAREIWQLAGRHPALKEREARQKGMDLMIQAITQGREEVFSLAAVEALTEEEREKGTNHIQAEVDAAKAQAEAQEEEKEGTKEEEKPEGEGTADEAEQPEEGSAPAEASEEAEAEAQPEAEGEAEEEAAPEPDEAPAEEPEPEPEEKPKKPRKPRKSKPKPKSKTDEELQHLAW